MGLYKNADKIGNGVEPKSHFDGLVQEGRNSIANALESFFH